MKPPLNQFWAYTGVLLLLWLITIIWVNPLGDFYINDDWSYAINAKALCDKNQIIFHDWGAMTLFVQTVWGSFFCKVFGFSFTSLRMSTLVLGFAALVASFKLGQEAGLKLKYAFWGSLILAFNPFFFQNAFSYMTEVPFLTFLLWACVFCFKDFKNKGRFNLIAISIFSVLAVLIRQPGILIPIIFAIVSFIRNDLETKAKILRLAPFAASLVSLHGFTLWRINQFGISKNFGRCDHLMKSLMDGTLVSNFNNFTPKYLALWGLCLIPLFIYFNKGIILNKGRSLRIVNLVLAIACALFFLDNAKQLFFGNTFQNFSLGLHTLPGLRKGYPYEIYQRQWRAISMFALFAGFLAMQMVISKSIQVVRLVRSKNGEPKTRQNAFLILGILGYYVFLMLHEFNFDRYSLTSFPFFVLLILSNVTKPKWPRAIIAGIAFLLIGGFTITATHDLMSWKRAHWTAIEYCFDELDSDMAKYKKDFKRKQIYLDKLSLIEQNQAGKDTTNYTLSFKPLEGEEVVRRFAFHKLLPPGRSWLYITRKKHH